MKFFLRPDDGFEAIVKARYLPSVKPSEIYPRQEENGCKEEEDAQKKEEDTDKEEEDAGKEEEDGRKEKEDGHGQEENMPPQKEDGCEQKEDSYLFCARLLSTSLRSCSNKEILYIYL